MKREELFRIVTENAADMIALVDVKGRRLYNSPAYEKMLGYTSGELAKTSAFEQIHPEDRMKVLEASREARRTGVGAKLEYRIKHKNGSWKVLESAASTIKNANGDVDKLSSSIATSPRGKRWNISLSRIRFKTTSPVCPTGGCSSTGSSVPICARIVRRTSVMPCCLS